MWHVFFLLICQADWDANQQDILFLSDQTFALAVSENTALLVQFYAPWCAHCKYLRPQFAQAATTLKTQVPQVKLAKVDATLNPLTAQAYNISAYPTIKLIQGSQISHYDGGRSASTIINWVKKQIKPYVQKVENIQKFIKQKDLVFIFFSEKHQNYLEVIKNTQGDYYGTASVSLSQNQKESLVAYKKHDDKKVVMEGEFTQENIRDFIEKNQLKWVMPFDDSVVKYVFGKHNPAVFLFRQEQDHEKYAPILHEVAQNLQGSVLITYTDLNTPLNQRFAQFIGFDPFQMPACLILQSDFSKFVFHDTIEVGKLIDFIREWENKNLPPFLKSEPVPEIPFINGVRTLVGKNFKEVIQSKNYVLVHFYSLVCGHCTLLVPELQTVAAAFGNDSRVLIASMDATKNQVDQLKIDKFPTVYLYENQKAPLQYKGPRDSKSIIAFMQESISNHKLDLQLRNLQEQ